MTTSAVLRTEAEARRHGPIPDGLVVMHACDNRICPNPAHLSIGTQEENMADCYAKQRNPRGESVGNHVLSAKQAKAIKYGGEGAKAAAAKYGVSRRTVWMIRKGLAWAHI